MLMPFPLFIVIMEKYTDNDATFCISYPDYEQNKWTLEQTSTILGLHFISFFFFF